MNFLARQYPFSNILHDINKVNRIDRPNLLSLSMKQHNINICLITEFSPEVNHFIQSIKPCHHISKDDRKIGGIFVQPAAYASKQPPNLRQFLVMNTITDDEPQSNNPCGKRRCEVCKHINTAIEIYVNHKTPGSYGCNSADIVYLILFQNALKHNILEKQAEASDTFLIITQTLSES